MNLLSKNVSRTASILGVVGLSAIALVNGVKPANAVTVKAGRDLLVTPDNGAAFFFTELNTFVQFKGLPIDPTTLGQTDTIARRINDVPAPSGITPLVIEDLSLQSVAPVYGSFDVFVGLNPNQQSTGTMTINHNNDDTGGTWDSQFTIFGTAVVVPTGSLTPGTPDFIKNLIANCPNANYQCINFDKGPFIASNEPWTHVAPPGAFIDPQDPNKNFYLDADKPVLHDAGDGTIHQVKAAVPEPMTILGSGAALVFGGFFRKKYSSKLKKEVVS